MGLFGGSSRRSDTTNVTETQAFGSGLEDSLQVGGDYTSYSLDDGAIDSAFEFGRDALDFGEGVSDESFSFAGRIADSADNLVNQNTVNLANTLTAQHAGYSDALDAIGQAYNSSFAFAAESIGRNSEGFIEAADTLAQQNQATLFSSNESIKNILMTGGALLVGLMLFKRFA